jgi:hypothetical protein
MCLPCRCLALRVTISSVLPFTIVAVLVYHYDPPVLVKQKTEPVLIKFMIVVICAFLHKYTTVSVDYSSHVWKEMQKSYGGSVHKCNTLELAGKNTHLMGHMKTHCYSLPFNFSTLFVLLYNKTTW